MIFIPIVIVNLIPGTDKTIKFILKTHWIKPMTGIIDDFYFLCRICWAVVIIKYSYKENFIFKQKDLNGLSTFFKSMCLHVSHKNIIYIFLKIFVCKGNYIWLESSRIINQGKCLMRIHMYWNYNRNTRFVSFLKLYIITWFVLKSIKF